MGGRELGGGGGGRREGGGREGERGGLIKEFIIKIGGHRSYEFMSKHLVLKI